MNSDPAVYLATIRVVHAGTPPTYDVDIPQPAGGTLAQGLEAAATPGGAYAVGDRVLVARRPGQMVILGRMQ